MTVLLESNFKKSKPRISVMSAPKNGNRMKRLSWWAVVVLVLPLLFNSCKKEPNGIDTPEPEPPVTEAELLFPTKDMRAVWVTTAWVLDWPRGDYSRSAVLRVGTEC